MTRFDPYYKWLGIAPEEQPASHYRLLGLREFEGDAEVIEAAADRQMRFLQDCASGERVADSQRLLNEVAAARLCLLIPDRKAAYDRQLHRGSVTPPAVRVRPIPLAPVPDTSRNPMLATIVSVALGAITAFGAYLLIREVDDSRARENARAAAQSPARPASENQLESPPARARRIEPQIGAPDAAPQAANGAGEVFALGQAPVDEVVRPAADADPPVPVLDEPAPDPPAFNGDEAALAAPDEPGRGAVEAPRPQQRQPVPDDESRQRLLAEVRRIFADEFSNLRTAADRAALAETLLQQGLETRDDPVGRYVLFDQARELGIEAANPDIVQKAVDAAAKEFEIDAFQAKVDALKAVSRAARTIGERQALVETALAVADTAAEAGEFDAGYELASLAYAVAGRIRDPALRTEAVERRDAIREARRRRDEAQTARDTLAHTPDDPRAHETLGLYLCFVVGDWPEGLEHLAQAENPVLRAAAERDLAAGEDPSAETMARVGDAWFELVKSASRSQRADFGIRAGDWYRRALEGLTGLDHARVQKQIAELDRLALRESQGSGQRVTGVKAAEGLIGRCLVDNADTGLILSYEQGQYIHNEAFRELLGQHGIAGAKLRIELHGVLAVPQDTTLSITHIGGTSLGGILRLYINERELGSVGDDRPKSTVYTLAVPKGLYAVRWSIAGGDIGPAHVEFADESGEAVPVFYTKAMLDRLRRLPTTAEVQASRE